MIPGTKYMDGQEVESPSELDCPYRCQIPAGQLLVQIVAPGTSFSIACPNDCGIAIRAVSDGPR